MTFRETWTADLRAAKLATGPVSLPSLIYKTFWVSLFHPRAACVFWLRVNQKFPSRLISAWREYTFHNDISFKAVYGPGFRVVHLSDIVIAAEARIGSNCTILNGVTIGGRRVGEASSIIIGDNVFIGTGSKILGTLSIGNNVTIGALSLVLSDIPSDSTAYGIPAKIAPRRTS